MSILEIAKIAGVSHGTVSNVINHRPNVSPQIVTRVRAAMKKISYTPPPPNKRRGPRAVEKTYKISFVRWQGDPLSFAIEKGIAGFAESSNLDFGIVDVNRKHDAFLDTIVHCEGIEGLILMPFESQEYRSAINTLINKGIHTVFVDQVLDGIDVSSVAADHFSGAYRLTRHLLEKHDCPVYYLGKTTQPSSCAQRCAGWQTAMSEFGFMNLDKYIFDFNHSDLVLNTSKDFALTEDCDLAGRLFEGRKERKYCIFANNDYVARGVYVTAAERGLQIGEDVFLGAFGNLPLCTRVPVPLTSVEQNSEMVGYEAARILQKHLKGELTQSVHITVPVELLVRASSTGENPSIDSSIK